MYHYSKSSLLFLESCHPDLQRLAHELIKHRDVRILEGHRRKELQDKYYHDGTSKTPWPKSKHNASPSLAVDMIPYPTPYWAWRPETPEQKKTAWSFWCEWGSWVRGVADTMGIKIRWGYDWDRDRDLHDQTFYDGPHFELLGGV